MAETNGVKSGNMTSEHRLEWFSTVLAILPILLPIIMESMDKGHWSYALLAGVLAIAVKLGSMNYGKNRAAVKMKALEAAAIASVPKDPSRP